MALPLKRSRPSACGTGCFATVMVHFMNGYGSYEREKKRQEDTETEGQETGRNGKRRTLLSA